MAQRAPFHLDKWYLDAVTDGGDSLIAYHAHLRFGPIRSRYGAVLPAPAHTPLKMRTTRRPGPPPELLPNEIRWNAPALDLAATWRGTVAPIRRTLLSDERGELIWHCLAPAAAVAGTFRARFYQARGYAERMTMTLRPWLLPIDTLRWGRFIGAAVSLVWIDWEGPSPRRWVFRDGVEVGAGGITDDAVRLAGGATLALDRRSTLRDAFIADSLGPARGLHILPFARYLRSRETKWLSHATLSAPGGGPVETGWAIHEAVRFHMGRTA